MIIKFDKVYERDIDLYLINSFCNCTDLVELFLKKINKTGYKVKSGEVSLTDENGESDVTFVLSKANHNIGLLIEVKIDAIAMPNQSGRYIKRGNKGVKEGVYDDYYVFIIAPNDYLNSNNEAQKYPYKIAYEELLDVITNEYGKTLFSSAIEKKKKGYTPIEDKDTTKFWNDLYNYVEKEYPDIKIYKVDGPRGSKPGWPHIMTDDKRVYIMYKSDRGYIDLTFNRLGKHQREFKNYMEKSLKKGMKIHQTGKSMAIRLTAPCVDFHNKFDQYQNELKEIMKKIRRLLKFLNKLDIDDLYDEVEK